MDLTGTSPDGGTFDSAGGALDGCTSAPIAWWIATEI